MAIRIVKLGSPRKPDEGLRLGTVRRPPRGVPKSEFAKRNFYDVWFPDLSPSPELMQAGRSAQKLQIPRLARDDKKGTGEKEWAAFTRKFRAEMNEPGAARILNLLAAFSHRTDFSLGCYCEDEKRCHRSILKALLAERGASFCL